MRWSLGFCRDKEAPEKGTELSSNSAGQQVVDDIGMQKEVHTEMLLS